MSRSPETENPDAHKDRPDPAVDEAAFVATSHSIIDLLDHVGIDDPTGQLAVAIQEGTIENCRSIANTQGPDKNVSDVEFLHAVEVLNNGPDYATTPAVARMTDYSKPGAGNRLQQLEKEGKLEKRELGQAHHWRVDDGPDPRMFNWG